MQSLKSYWEDYFQSPSGAHAWWQRKRRLLEKHQAKIVHIKGRGRLYRSLECEICRSFEYILYLSFIIEQKRGVLRNEAMLLPYRVKDSTDHELIKASNFPPAGQVSLRPSSPWLHAKTYSRLAVVRYAERWWGAYNPVFSAWEDTSLSFVFQCVYAGFNQSFIHQQPKGFILSEEAIVSSLKNIAAREVKQARELRLGDIILYDLTGEDHWDLAAVVTAKDIDREPLVNLWEPASQYRFWSLEDSSKWSEKTKYKFLQID